MGSAAAITGVLGLFFGFVARWLLQVKSEEHDRRMAVFSLLSQELREMRDYVMRQNSAIAEANRLSGTFGPELAKTLYASYEDVDDALRAANETRNKANLLYLAITEELRKAYRQYLMSVNAYLDEADMSKAHHRMMDTGVVKRYYDRVTQLDKELRMELDRFQKTQNPLNGYY